MRASLALLLNPTNDAIDPASSRAPCMLADVPKDDDAKEQDFVSTFGGVKVDWPRALGYYTAVGVAVAFEVIAPPLGIFIALVPLVKFAKRPNAPKAARFIASIFEGAGKPVGGDAEGVIRPAKDDEEDAKQPERIAAAPPEGIPGFLEGSNARPTEN